MSAEVSQTISGRALDLIERLKEKQNGQPGSLNSVINSLRRISGRDHHKLGDALLSLMDALLASRKLAQAARPDCDLERAQIIGIMKACGHRFTRALAVLFPFFSPFDIMPYEMILKGAEVK